MSLDSAKEDLLWESVTPEWLRETYAKAKRCGDHSTILLCRAVSEINWVCFKLNQQNKELLEYKKRVEQAFEEAKGERRHEP